MTECEWNLREGRDRVSIRKDDERRSEKFERCVNTPFEYPSIRELKIEAHDYLNCKRKCKFWRYVKFHNLFRIKTYKKYALRCILSSVHSEMDTIDIGFIRFCICKKSKKIVKYLAVNIFDITLFSEGKA